LQNLEVKKINDEKKAALAAQFAAEATLRRVHAAQKDDDMPPIEAILAPLEAELKLARQEVTFYIVYTSCAVLILGQMTSIFFCDSYIADSFSICSFTPITYLL
jgi:hypothetical protein